MKQGYQRLQALCRSRLLTHRFTALRGKMMLLQRYCRSYIERSQYQGRMQAVTVIQAGVRKVIAAQRYNRLKIEVSECFVWCISCD